jgi:hypothetical protein
MTLVDYIIDIALIALVILQIRGSRLDLKTAIRPVIRGQPRGQPANRSRNRATSAGPRP